MRNNSRPIHRPTEYAQNFYKNRSNPFQGTFVTNTMTREIYTLDIRRTIE